MIRLAYPWVLLLLLLLPLLVWRWRQRNRRPVVRFSDLSMLRAAGRTVAARCRGVLPVLRIVGLACLIVAAARPQRADQSSQTYAEGIAILMVVDTSGSMSDLDLSPPGKRLNRLDVVKDVFRRFVQGQGEGGGRKNDLIGMIRFARYADSVCPLTLDHKSLIDVLSQTDLVRSRNEDGTAIGDGLALAVERLRELKRTTGSGEQLRITSRVVILLTDGENNFGMVEPQAAGDLAALQGIKVYTILAGTGRNAGFVRVPVDDTDLRKIADVTGGKFFHATDAGALENIYAEIDKLERTKVEERRFTRWGELALPLLLAAFACLSLHSLLDSTWLRRSP
jgi:Ca-activated chloride channel family protein